MAPLGAGRPGGGCGSGACGEAAVDVGRGGPGAAAAGPGEASWVMVPTASNAAVVAPTRRTDALWPIRAGRPNRVGQATQVAGSRGTATG